MCGRRREKSTGYLNHTVIDWLLLNVHALMILHIIQEAFLVCLTQSHERDVINYHFWGNKSIMQVFAILAFYDFFEFKRFLLPQASDRPKLINDWKLLLISGTCNPFVNRMNNYNFMVLKKSRKTQLAVHVKFFH